MKTKTTLTKAVTLAGVSLFALASCTNFDTPAKNDAATGALIGAGAGAALSNDKAEGAAIGAALGGGAGYLYGNNKR